MSTQSNNCCGLNFSTRKDNTGLSISISADDPAKVESLEAVIKALGEFCNCNDSKNCC